MRKTLALTLLLAACVTAGPRVSFAGDSPFDQANAKYRSGDFKAAVAGYENVARTSGATGAVLYNLGNATLRAGEKGMALVHYERALRATPRDKDLRWNMHILKASLADQIEDKSHFAISALREYLSYLRTDEIMMVFTGCLLLLVLIAAAVFFKPASAAWLAWLKGIALVFFILSGAILGLKAWEGKDPLAVVLDKETYAYFGPSDKETKAFLLHQGAEGRITDESGDWIYLSLLNKKSGWVRKNACEIV